MPNIWIDTNIDNDVAIGTQFVLSLMTGIAATQTRFERMTLRRTVIGMDVARTVHDSGEGSERIGIGIGITSQEAFTTSPPAVPDPLNPADFPVRGWIWRGVYRVFGFAADQPAIFTRRIDLDLRSQRKLENGEAFLVSDVLAVEGSNSTVRITGMIRQLWLVG